MICSADVRDIDALVEIENASFDTDRLSRRSFRYMLTKANAVTLVAEHEGRVCGDVIILFNTCTSLAVSVSIRGAEPGGWTKRPWARLATSQNPAFCRRRMSATWSSSDGEMVRGADASNVISIRCWTPPIPRSDM